MLWIIIIAFTHMKCIQLRRLWQIIHMLYHFTIYSQDPFNSRHSHCLSLFLRKISKHFNSRRNYDLRKHAQKNCPKIMMHQRVFLEFIQDMYIEIQMIWGRNYKIMMILIIHALKRNVVKNSLKMHKLRKNNQFGFN